MIAKKEAFIGIILLLCLLCFLVSRAAATDDEQHDFQVDADGDVIMSDAVDDEVGLDLNL